MEENLKQLPSSLIKVVLFGPESTGKTTLAKALAEYYNTKWIPEFAREYLEEKLTNTGKLCAPEDIYSIALGQIKLENQGIKKANKFVFCDTTLLSTQVYAEAYFNGWCDERVILANTKNSYDIYFLTDIDVPWKADALRDKPNQRQEMFDKFKGALQHRNLTYSILRGSNITRMNCVIEQINQYV